MQTNKVFVAGIAYRDLDGNPLSGRHGDQKLFELFGRAGKIAKKKITRRDGTETEVDAANIATDRDTKLSLWIRIRRIRNCRRCSKSY